jgi:translation initiation factor 5B
MLGINAALFYDNTDYKRIVSLVPISAITGEGISDLLQLVSKLTSMSNKLICKDEFECYVMEVNKFNKTSVDIILKNGTIKQGDNIFKYSW